MPQPDDDMPVADPVPADDDLPIATPVAPPAARPWPAARPAGPRRPETVEPADPPRSRPLAACGVMGCLGVVILVVLGFLAYVAVTVVGQLGNEIGNTRGDEPESPRAGRVRPGPVAATALAPDRLTVELPGECYAVARAGSGRFLLLGVRSRVTGKTSVEVFDPNEGRIVRSIDTGADTVMLAGTAANVFVARPDRVERYDLAGNLERAGAFPAGPTALVAGAATDGPVLAVATRNDAPIVVVYDAEELVAVPKGTAVDGLRGAGPRAVVRAAADGKLVGVGSNARHGALLRVEGGRPGDVTALDGPDTVGHVAPAADGRFVYTARGVFGPDGRLAFEPRKKEPYFYTLPAAHGGDFYLSLDVGGAGVRKIVRLHLAGERDEVGTLATADGASVDGPVGLTATDAEALPADLRVHLWPAAGLVAVIPIGTRVELYKVDVSGLLRASGRDHLVFGSDPPTVAARGQPLAYAPVVWSSADGGPEFQVTSGPPGARFDGPRFVWDVPADFAAGEVVVQLRAAHAGRTADQSFRVVVQ